jgi:hypothetical protein
MAGESARRDNIQLPNADRDVPKSMGIGKSNPSSAKQLTNYESENLKCTSNLEIKCLSVASSVKKVLSNSSSF